MLHPPKFTHTPRTHHTHPLWSAVPQALLIPCSTSCLAVWLAFGVGMILVLGCLQIRGRKSGSNPARPGIPVASVGLAGVDDGEPRQRWLAVRWGALGEGVHRLVREPQQVEVGGLSLNGLDWMPAGMSHDETNMASPRLPGHTPGHVLLLRAGAHVCRLCVARPCWMRLIDVVHL